MLARKISATSGASAGRYGRIASLGCARAVIALRPLLRPPRGPLARWADASEASGRVRGSSPRPPHPPRGFAARHPLPQGERVSGRASRSSRDLPGGAVLRVLQYYAHCRELVTDAVCLPEIFGFTCCITLANERRDPGLVDRTPTFGPARNSECPQCRPQRGQIAATIQCMQLGNRLWRIEIVVQGVEDRRSERFLVALHEFGPVRQRLERVVAFLESPQGPIHRLPIMRAQHV